MVPLARRQAGQTEGTATVDLARGDILAGRGLAPRHLADRSQRAPPLDIGSGVGDGVDKGTHQMGLAWGEEAVRSYRGTIGADTGEGLGVGERQDASFPGQLRSHDPRALVRHTLPRDRLRIAVVVGIANGGIHHLHVRRKEVAREEERFALAKGRSVRKDAVRDAKRVDLGSPKSAENAVLETDPSSLLHGARIVERNPLYRHAHAIAERKLTAQHDRVAAPAAEGDVFQGGGGGRFMDTRGQIQRVAGLQPAQGAGESPPSQFDRGAIVGVIACGAHVENVRLVRMGAGVRSVGTFAPQGGRALQAEVQVVGISEMPVPFRADAVQGNAVHGRSDLTAVVIGASHDTVLDVVHVEDSPADTSLGQAELFGALALDPEVTFAVTPGDVVAEDRRSRHGEVIADAGAAGVVHEAVANHVIVSEEADDASALGAVQVRVAVHRAMGDLVARPLVQANAPRVEIDPAVSDDAVLRAHEHDAPDVVALEAQAELPGAVKAGGHQSVEDKALRVVEMKAGPGSDEHSVMVLRRSLEVGCGDVELLGCGVVVTGTGPKLEGVDRGAFVHHGQGVHLGHRFHRAVKVGGVDEPVAFDRSEDGRRHISAQHGRARDLGTDHGLSPLRAEAIASHRLRVLPGADGQRIAGLQGVHALLDGAKGSLGRAAVVCVGSALRDVVFGSGQLSHDKQPQQGSEQE